MSVRADSVAEARDAALVALARKELTLAETGALLGRRGFDEVTVCQVLAWLEESDLLDDARFAGRYAEDKRSLAGWGRERIAGALAGRGVDADTIQAALADETTELDRALEALRERRRPAGSDRERQSALAFLARRGYELEVAYEAVRAHERG